jgi:CheY-like chemotaxis protein
MSSSLLEPAPATTSQCVLVVEDEMLIAMMLEGMLKAMGHRVIKAARVGKALGLVATEAIDFAILDINLAGETSYKVAEELCRRGIPFAFSTGYAAEALRAEFREFPLLRKPYGAGEIQRALANARH